MPNATSEIQSNVLPKPAALASNPLQRAVRRVVGHTFFGTLMKISEENPLKPKYGHGGRGEEIFRRQLHMNLVGQVSVSTRLGLAEEIYQRMVKRVPQDASAESDLQIDKVRLSVVG